MKQKTHVAAVHQRPGQVELMHYLKSLTLPVSYLPFTQSHKRLKVTGTMETRRSSILPAHARISSNAHTRWSKKLTYRCSRKAMNAQTCSCSALSLLWIPCHVSCSSPVTPPLHAISLSLSLSLCLSLSLSPPDLIIAPLG